jgi:hypothetical protein
VKALNPGAVIFEISAKTGGGIVPWAEWLRSEVKAWNGAG